jgi:hypothetical protein
MLRGRHFTVDMILVGPVGYKGPRDEGSDFEAGEMVYKGFRLVARAKRGPIGWIGELTVLFPPDDSRVHAVLPIPRFHADPLSAIREAHLQGILRVDRGDVIRF